MLTPDACGQQHLIRFLSQMLYNVCKTNHNIYQFDLNVAYSVYERWKINEVNVFLIENYRSDWFETTTSNSVEIVLFKWSFKCS